MFRALVISLFNQIFIYSTKSEKSPSNNTITSPISSSGGVSQLIPHKLVDKKVSVLILIKYLLVLKIEE